MYISTRRKTPNIKSFLSGVIITSESVAFGPVLSWGALVVDGVRNGFATAKGAPAEAEFCQALLGLVVSLAVACGLESLATLPLYAVSVGDLGSFPSL